MEALNNQSSQSKRKGRYLYTKKYKESLKASNKKTDILSSQMNIAESSDAATTSKKSYNEPAFFSPCIVSSHGKTNALEEQQLRCDFSLETPTKDSVVTDLKISVEEEEWTAQHFQFLLNREMERLNELCKKWQEVKDKPKTTEDGQYQIHQAIGQTNLLINKKFERFRSLISDCETGKGEMLVRCTDLQGFWDVICIEVRNCNSRFEKIEKLCLRGWRELKEKSLSKPVAGSTRKRAIARKKVINTEQFRVTEKHVSNKSENENASSTQYKTRGSVSISVIDQKDTRSSLLRDVQLSEARIKTPLIIIKISQMCKTPEVQLDNSISYVNSDQTLRKSVPKQLKNSTKTNSCVKSECMHVHNNVRLAEIPVDDKTQVKRDLAEASAKIDHLDFDYSDLKKLSLNNSSSEEFKDDSQQNSQMNNIKNQNLVKTPRVTVQAATSITQVSSLKRNLRRQNVLAENSKQYKDSPSNNANEQNNIVRVLRNRTVYSINTPQPKRKSLTNKENKTPSRTKKKFSKRVLDTELKVTSKDKENEIDS